MLSSSCPASLDFSPEYTAHCGPVFGGQVTDSTTLQDGSMAKTGDFGFNSLKPEIGVREILPRDNNDRSLSFHNIYRPRFVFPVDIIRTIPFDQILNASQLSKGEALFGKAQS
jgi:hypothetical protein